MSAPAERGRKRELSLGVWNYVSLFETRCWRIPAHLGLLDRSARGRNTPTPRRQKLPSWSALPAATVGGPPQSHTTTEATRSTQFGCNRLAHPVKLSEAPSTNRKAVRDPIPVCSAKSSRMPNSEASVWKYQKEGSLSARRTLPKHQPPFAYVLTIDGGSGCGGILFFAARAAPLVKRGSNNSHLTYLFVSSAPFATGAWTQIAAVTPEHRSLPCYSR